MAKHVWLKSKNVEKPLVFVGIFEKGGMKDGCLSVARVRKSKVTQAQTAALPPCRPEALRVHQYHRNPAAQPQNPPKPYAVRRVHPKPPKPFALNPEWARQDTGLLTGFEKLVVSCCTFRCPR